MTDENKLANYDKVGLWCLTPRLTIFQ